MAIAIPVDTLQFVKTLTESGVPLTQAEAHAKAVFQAYNVDHLATKHDLKEVRQEIKEVRQELKYEIDLKCAELKTDMIKWVIGIVFTVSVAQGAAIVSWIKLLH